jgi:hypothetical protein
MQYVVYSVQRVEIRDVYTIPKVGGQEQTSRHRSKSFHLLYTVYN